MRIHHSRVYTDEDIEHAMATVARVVELYGDAYWPILERLERELIERRTKAARLNSHLRRFHKRKPLQISQADLSAVKHQAFP